MPPRPPRPPASDDEDATISVSALSQWWVWDTGATDNGGGFSAEFGGTNYARQASPQLTVTDGSMNTGNTTLSSVTGGFTPAMVGNTVGVTQGGVFRGYWQITAYTNTNTVTVDRVGAVTAATHTIKVGGALKFTNVGFGPQTTTAASHIQAGQKIWIKYGAYTPSTNDLTFGSGAVNGAPNNPIIAEGYYVTEGDIWDDPTLPKPTITPTGAAMFALILNGNYIWVRGLELHGQTGNAAVSFGAASIDCLVEKCKVVASSVAAAVSMGGSKCTLRNNHIVAGSSASDAVLVLGTDTQTVEDNTITCAFGNTFGGIVVACDSATIRRNRISNFTFGILNGSGTVGHHLIESNDIYHNVNGIYLNNAAQGLGGFRVHANIFVNNTAFHIRHNTADYSVLATYPNNDEGMEAQFDCNFFLDGTGVRYSQLSVGSNDITLSADPFTDAANGDFSLNNAAGGGTLVRATLCEIVNPDALNSSSLYAGSGGVPATSSGSSAVYSIWREYTNEDDDDVIPDAVIDIYNDAAIQALNRRIGYHITTDSTSIVFVAETQEYSIPDDLIEVVWIEWNGRELPKQDIEQWRKDGTDWRNERSSEPRAWATYGNKIVFYPKPNAEAVARQASPIVRYISRPPAFASAGFEQLNEQDVRVAIYLSVAEFSGAHPDSAIAIERSKSFTQRFESEVALIAEQYHRRATER